MILSQTALYCVENPAPVSTNRANVSNYQIALYRQYLEQWQSRSLTSLLSFGQSNNADPFSSGQTDQGLFNEVSLFPNQTLPNTQANPQSFHTGASLLGTFLNRELDYFEHESEDYSNSKVVGIHLEEEQMVLRLENTIDIRLQSFEAELGTTVQRKSSQQLEYEQQT
ncbi:MAG: hypothetical protein HRT90_04175, partial [Candidatus Margulisbacteria bacterium]|nr:hypothetical protein [Candidatus Margulisiibacteriota bacterium]